MYTQLVRATVYNTHSHIYTTTLGTGDIHSHNDNNALPMKRHISVSFSSMFESGLSSIAMLSSRTVPGKQGGKLSAAMLTTALIFMSHIKAAL